MVDLDFFKISRFFYFLFFLVDDFRLGGAGEKGVFNLGFFFLLFGKSTYIEGKKKKFDPVVSFVLNNLL